MLIIPLHVDVPRERTPWGNWLIITVIIGFFAWQINQVRTYHTTITDELNHIASNNSSHSFKIKTDIFNGFVLKDWNLRGLLGHVFLHGGYVHIIGNLLFLWIFGNAVSAKIGNAKFIFIFLLLGIGAGVAHLFFKGGACVGASGAINGIVGMYLMLFPTNSISCFLLIILPVFYSRFFEVSSYAMILFWLMFDIYGAAAGGGDVAYFAHIGGFASGIIIAGLLLMTKMVKMCSYEKSLFQVFAKQEEPKFHRTVFYNRIFTNVNEEEIEKLGTEKIKEELIRVQCRCGMKYKISAKFSGKSAKCPKCSQPVRIP